MFMSKAAQLMAAAALMAGLGMSALAAMPGTASASPTPAVAEVQATSSNQASTTACYVVPKGSVRAVTVRSAPRTSSSALGQINRGQSANAVCNATYGGAYSSAGCTPGHWWVRVTWKGRTGYVALGCVAWYRR